MRKLVLLSLSLSLTFKCIMGDFEIIVSIWKKREGKRKESITALSPCDVEFAYVCAFDKCSWSEEGELVGGETPHNSIYTCSVFNTKNPIFFPSRSIAQWRRKKIK